MCQSQRDGGMDSPHILDLLLTNEEHMITHLEYQSALGKSDNSVLHFKYNCYTFTRNKRSVKKLYDKADYNAIEEIIRNIKWGELLGGPEDINSKWDKFQRKIEDLEEKYVPRKKQNQITRKTAHSQ